MFEYLDYIAVNANVKNVQGKYVNYLKRHTRSLSSTCGALCMQSLLNGMDFAHHWRPCGGLLKFNCSLYYFWWMTVSSTITQHLQFCFNQWIHISWWWSNSEKKWKVQVTALRNKQNIVKTIKQMELRYIDKGKPKNKIFQKPGSFRSNDSKCFANHL